MKLLLLLPTLALAKHYLVTYNCNDFRDRCQDDLDFGGKIHYENAILDTVTPEICQARFNACNDCASREYQCRWDADDSKPEHINCSKEAQLCYRNATSPRSTIGYYTCKQAYKTCKLAPMTGKGMCLKQLNKCRKCQAKEKFCRFEMGTKRCDDGAHRCYFEAMGRRAFWSEAWGCWTVDGACSNGWKKMLE